MKIEQLRVLHAIVTTGSFREAAATLHRSQPALTQAIKVLEAEIGLTLLSREHYRPVLTPAGEAFYRQAKTVLAEMQVLSNLTRKLAAFQEPQVTLSVTATCPLKPLLATVDETIQQYPDTHIRLLSDAMGGAAERLMNGEADIVVTTMDGLSTEEVEALPYMRIEIIPVTRPDYGPNRKSGRISTVTMSRFTQVITSGTGRGTFEQSRDVLNGTLRWTVADFAAKKEVIMAGMGWGGLPEHMIRSELKAGKLVKLDLAEFPPRHSSLYQIRRRDHQAGMVGTTLWEALQNSANRR